MGRRRGREEDRLGSREAFGLPLVVVVLCSRPGLVALVVVVLVLLVVLVVLAVLEIGLVQRCQEDHHRLAALFACGLSLGRRSWLRGPRGA